MLIFCIRKYFYKLKLCGYLIPDSRLSKSDPRMGRLMTTKPFFPDCDFLGKTSFFYVLHFNKLFLVLL